MNENYMDVFENGGFNLETIDSIHDGTIKLRCNIGQGIRAIITINNKTNRSSCEFQGMDNVKIEDTGLVMRFQRFFMILKEIVD